jgi:hypothetical protein
MLMDEVNEGFAGIFVPIALFMVSFALIGIFCFEAELAVKILAMLRLDPSWRTAVTCLSALVAFFCITGAI